MDHAEALRNLTDDYDAGYEQRELAAKDMAFSVLPGGHWEGFLPNYAENAPRLQYDLINDYLNRFMGEYVSSRIMPEFRSETGSDQDAEILTGLHRKDFRRNMGQVAFDTAVWEAERAGMGAFKLSTEYAEESRADSDEQIITYRPIHSAYNTVIFDHAAQRADKADAGRCVILHQYTKDSWRKQYEDRPLPTGVDPDGHHFNWAGGRDHVYAAERYDLEIERVMAEVWVNIRTQEHRTYFPSELKDMDPRDMKAVGWEKIRERKVVQRRVHRSIMDVNGYIEEPKLIAGNHIPVVPVYCFRGYVDGQEFYQGLVRDKKDAQRSFNLQMSKLAEQAATTSRLVPILSPEQVDRHRNAWASGPNDKPYLLLDDVVDHATGQKVPRPIQYLEPPAVDQATAALIELNQQHLRERTGGAPQTTEDPDRSGKAILALQDQIDLNTHVFMDNIRMSVMRAGTIYAGIASEVYADNRHVTIINSEDKERRVQLMEMQPDQQGRMKPINNINSGRFEVIASAGPAYQSKREATVENLQSILPGLEAMPEFQTAVVSVMLANMEGTGFDPVHKVARQKLIEMGIQAPETDEEKQYAASLQEQQGQPGEQEKLMTAMAAQAEGEAQSAAASAIEKQTKAALNMANVEKIRAETSQIDPNARAERIKKFQDAQVNQLKVIGG